MKIIKKNIEITIFSLTTLALIIGYILLGGDKLVVLQKGAMFTFLLFAIFFTIKKKDKTGLVFALLFTVLSDALLITDSSITELIRASAMVSFCLAQLFHMFFLNSEVNKKQALIFSIIRISLSLIAIVIILILQMGSALVIFTTIYFIMLVLNLIQSFVNFKEHRLMAIGYIFFIICDLFVGIDTGIALGIFPAMSSSVAKIFYSINTIDWVFYMLAQYLFVLFIFVNNKKGLSILQEKQLEA